jgi:hypothetical protein
MNWFDKGIKNFPFCFGYMAKMNGDILEADIGTECYWIDTISQISGVCDIEDKDIRFYSKSHSGIPINPITRKLIIRKKIRLLDED